jgi:hypothetical protein
MVALAVPRFGMIVELNFARAFLHRAADALNRDDVIACGCLLREAVRRQLWAECHWYDCLPEGATHKTSPWMLLAALNKAGHCNEGGYQIAKEAIGYGNTTAHCGRVKPSYLRWSIQLFHDIIDSCPCHEPANLLGAPKADQSCCWDDDDDDHGDDWKLGIGGAA